VGKLAHQTLLLFVSGCLYLGLFACSAEPTTSTQPLATTTFVPQVIIFAPTATPIPPALPTATQIPVTLTPVPTLKALNLDPFTGLPVTDTNRLNRRPVLVKVANTSEIRPQSGLGQADVVVEHYAEGGITRFTALFLANAPIRVGSVRSCRLIDIELAPIFGASLTCSGTSAGVRPFLLASTFIFPTGSADDGIGFVSDFGPYECETCPMFRVDDRPMPHNLFANTANIWSELDNRKQNTATEFKSWIFDSVVPVAGITVTSVALPYLSGEVEWTYDEATGKWLRSISGEPHKDADNDQQLRAANVLVVYAQHEYTSIIEDANGSRTIRVWLWGTGKVNLYRDGKIYAGTWERPQDSSYIFNLHDANGNPLVMKPGNTWIQIVPEDFQVMN
jgi:hypothetical protein